MKDRPLCGRAHRGAVAPHHQGCDVTTGNKLISPNEAAKRLTLGRSSINRLVRTDPHFPQPVRVSTHRIAFVEDEVQAYLDARVNSRAARAS